MTLYMISEFKVNICSWRLYYSLISRNHRELQSFPTRRSSDLIRVNRAKKSGMVNITSSVNSRERSGINTILHELNPLLTLLVIDRKSGSAGMPRPISYAVFCLKKKKYKS